MSKENGAKGTIPNKEDLDLAIKQAELLLKSKTANCEGFLISIHTLQGESINHSFQYENWRNGDWGNCMVSMGVEAKRASMSPTAKDRA